MCRWIEHCNIHIWTYIYTFHCACMQKQDVKDEEKKQIAAAKCVRVQHECALNIKRVVVIFRREMWMVGEPIFICSRSTCSWVYNRLIFQMCWFMVCVCARVGWVVCFRSGLKAFVYDAKFNHFSLPPLILSLIMPIYKFGCVCENYYLYLYMVNKIIYLG